MNSACMVLPSEAGLRSTMTPAASRAEILESAPPLPPLTMAPVDNVRMLMRRETRCWSLLTSVTHTSARRSRDTGDEGDNGLVGSVVLLEEVGGVLLGGTTDLANHDDTVSLAVLEEDLEAVDEVGTREGVTTNTNDERLTKTGLGGLVDGLVGESTGTGDDTDATTLVDEARHDTDLALSL